MCVILTYCVNNYREIFTLREASTYTMYMLLCGGNSIPPSITFFH